MVGVRTSSKRLGHSLPQCHKFYTTKRKRDDTGISFRRSHVLFDGAGSKVGVGLTHRALPAWQSSVLLCPAWQSSVLLCPAGQIVLRETRSAYFRRSGHALPPRARLDALGPPAGIRDRKHGAAVRVRAYARAESARQQGFRARAQQYVPWLVPLELLT
jgi:hypothetical protein